MSELIKWSNLKANLCPKCGKDLAGSFSDITKMFTCVCGFKISMEKFTSITTNQAKQDIDARLRGVSDDDNY